MRYWIYCEPVGETAETVWQVWSEKAILAEYWDDWCRQMRAGNKANEIAETNCITDWIVTHWAVAATPENLQKIIQAPKGQ